MRSNKRTTTHPGVVLRDEFLEPLGLTQTELAKHLGVPIQRINELIRGKRGVTPDTAWLLAKALGTSPEFWMNLQMHFDLSSVVPPKGIKRLVA